jgi:hypothetical protein
MQVELLKQVKGEKLWDRPAVHGRRHAQAKSATTNWAKLYLDKVNKHSLTRSFIHRLER